VGREREREPELQIIVAPGAVDVSVEELRQVEERPYHPECWGEWHRLYTAGKRGTARRPYWWPQAVVSDAMALSASVA
jgi:hypothetical protein